MSKSPVNLDYDNAACVGAEDPDIFFPTKGGSESREVALAKAMCDGCAIKLQCLDHGLHHEREGIWGGTTPVERDALRKKLRIFFDPIDYDRV
jgi:WhiB family redox-sensing transcriptional regulator